MLVLVLWWFVHSSLSALSYSYSSNGVWKLQMSMMSNLLNFRTNIEMVFLIVESPCVMRGFRLELKAINICLLPTHHPSSTLGDGDNHPTYMVFQASWYCICSNKESPGSQLLRYYHEVKITWYHFNVIASASPLDDFNFTWRYKYTCYNLWLQTES